MSAAIGKEGPEPEIAPAAWSDAGALRALKAEVHGLHMDARPDFFRRIEECLTEATLGRWLEGGEYELLVARVAGANGGPPGEALGYVLLVRADVPEDGTHVPRRRLLVEELCVAKAARGRGLGRALMAAAEGRARDSGCASLELSVWAFNEEALGFYRALGFAPRLVRMELALRPS